MPKTTRSTISTNILLGVTGGIAAYKALEVVRLVTKAGWKCQVIMTRSAARLVTRESFEALTGRRVAIGLWESDSEFRPGSAFGDESRPIHIDLAQMADVFLIAPATANILAKMAAGVADDLLTTSYLAATCPVLAAPAMNKFMWEHPTTQRNIAQLEKDGVQIVSPGEGPLACGYDGVGRLASPEEQMAAIECALGGRNGDLVGRRVLVTAGRTEEPLDPVRLLTNRSSGRMGVAIASEARRRGAEVVLVAGAMSVDPPEGVRLIEARTVSEMAENVVREARGKDIVIMAAAVGDFRAKNVSGSKTRRTGPITIELEPTEDILKSIGDDRESIGVLIGFALETDSIEENGRRKLEKKNLDLIVVNRPDVPGGGIDQPKTEAILLGRNGLRDVIPLVRKSEIARRLLDRAVEMLDRR